MFILYGTIWLCLAKPAMCQGTRLSWWLLLVSLSVSSCECWLCAFAWARGEKVPFWELLRSARGRLPQLFFDALPSRKLFLGRFFWLPCRLMTTHGLKTTPKTASKASWNEGGPVASQEFQITSLFRNSFLLGLSMQPRCVCLGCGRGQRILVLIHLSPQFATCLLVSLLCMKIM